ncbi:MAG: hypothetical protein KAS12_00695, partial [Candidatus Aenigmarchaeota archaeon]|nr:hypothetical protein [Candidatus Aenigmarchaeota archaeon]
LGIVLIFSILYFVGSGITGNLFLSTSDRQLASSPDFPQLSQFEANKQYYLCGNDLTLTKQQKITINTQLETSKLGLNNCLTQQTQTTNELNTAKTSYSTCNTALSTCTTNNTDIEEDLEFTEIERDTYKEDLDELQDDFYYITDRYAKIKCCDENSDGDIEDGYLIKSNGHSINCEVYDSNNDDMRELSC